MFGTMGHAAARARYAQVDLGSKVEGANPHRLIGILYEDLLRTLDTMAAALGQPSVGAAALGRPGGGAAAMRPGMADRRARAASILLGLETSLDHGRGGDLSLGLAAVYREARRLIAAGIAAGDAAPIVQAREMIAEIAEAWSTIG